MRLPWSQIKKQQETQDAAAPQELGSPSEPPVCAGEEVAGFAIAAAAIRGPSHVKNGTPGDDRFSWNSKGNRVCAVVSDGAGSAANGRFGAEHVSAGLCEDLLAAMDNAELSLPTVEAAIRASVNATRRHLLFHHDGAQIADFHATVVGAIWDNSQGFFFHVGDGVAAALPQDGGAPSESESWANAIISEPENGAYSDQTYFFTMDPLRLRLKAFPCPAALALMTDGAASLSYTTAVKSLEGGFFAPITQHWIRVASSEQMAEQLALVLTTAEASTMSDDDKCLLLVRKL